MITFAYPIAILLLFLPFLCRYLPPIKGAHGDALKVPFVDDIKNIYLSSGGLWASRDVIKAKPIKLISLSVIWLLLVISAMRPQLKSEPVRIPNEGRDILMVVDISKSMLEPDFSYQRQRINRLSAVKAVVNDFINKRVDDRLGLILFGTRAYLQAPITYDKKSVGEILWNTDAGMAGDSTSIGDALGLALKTLKDDKEKDKKAIILLTDGENNDGSLSMAEAINLASEEEIKVYTIGVGAPQAFFSSFLGIKVGSSGLDEKSLKKLASVTKGNYFRAETTADLVKIYQTIDKLEAREKEASFVVEVTELYYIPLLLAILLAMFFAIMFRRLTE